jgi:hypothetical protein
MSSRPDGAWSCGKSGDRSQETGRWFAVPCRLFPGSCPLRYALIVSQEIKTGVSDGPNTFWRAGVARGKSTTTANSSETPRASRRVVTCQQLPASVSFLKHAARQNNTNRASAAAHRRNVFRSNALRRDKSAARTASNCALEPAYLRLVAIRCKRHFRALLGHTVLGGIEQPWASGRREPPDGGRR